MELPTQRKMRRRVRHGKKSEGELDSSGLRQGNVTGCYEHGINPLDSTKRGESQDYLRTYKYFLRTQQSQLLPVLNVATYSAHQLIP